MSEMLKHDKTKTESPEKFKNRVFGNRVMMRRKQLGIKQSELAEILGISDNQVSNIENGRSFPKMNNFIRLCEVLDCNADYLLSGIVKNTVPQQINEMIALLSPEKQKTLWILLNSYIHESDMIQFDI